MCHYDVASDHLSGPTFFLWTWKPVWMLSQAGLLENKGKSGQTDHPAVVPTSSQNIWATLISCWSQMSDIGLRVIYQSISSWGFERQ